MIGGRDAAAVTAKRVRRRRIGIDETDVQVRSKFLLHRSQGGSTGYELIAGERLDVLHAAGGDTRLLTRVVYLSHTTLPTMNLGVFL